MSLVRARLALSDLSSRRCCSLDWYRLGWYSGKLPPVLVVSAERDSPCWTHRPKTSTCTSTRARPTSPSLRRSARPRAAVPRTATTSRCRRAQSRPRRRSAPTLSTAPPRPGEQFCAIPKQAWMLIGSGRAFSPVVEDIVSIAGTVANKQDVVAATSLSSSVANIASDG